nr:hypothetical protein [Tanacetum cinerariifolium]
GKEIVIIESSVKRDLQLVDEEGIDCLPNSTIFEQLALMGFLQIFFDQQPDGVPTHKRKFSAPLILQPSSSQPQKTQKPRKPKRKDTQVPQPSGLTESVTDEAVHKELGDSLVRAATTASSLEAQQDSGNITTTQSKATPNESSSQGTDSGGGPRVESFRDEESLGEDASKHWRRIDAIDKDEYITLVSVQHDADKEMFDVDDLGGEEVFVVGLDEEAALKLQSEFDEEERLAKERAEKEQEANIALIEEWDDIQAKIDDDHQLTERLQVQEQE